MSGPADGVTSVYKYYDDADRLIYIGITAQRIGRQVQHNDSSEWWPYVARQEIEHHPSRAEALAIERGLIELHRPPFNKQYNDRHELIRDAYLAIREAERRLDVIQGGGNPPLLPPSPCGHCESCRGGNPRQCYTREPYGDPEDPWGPHTCPRCRRPGCTYGIGFHDGEMHGFKAGMECGRQEMTPWMTCDIGHLLLTGVVDGRASPVTDGTRKFLWEPLGGA